MEDYYDYEKGVDYDEYADEEEPQIQLSKRQKIDETVNVRKDHNISENEEEETGQVEKGDDIDKDPQSSQFKQALKRYSHDVEVVGPEISSDIASLANAMFEFSITKARFSELLESIHRPANLHALTEVV